MFPTNDTNFKALVIVKVMVEVVAPRQQANVLLCHHAMFTVFLFHLLHNLIYGNWYHNLFFNLMLVITLQCP